MSTTVSVLALNGIVGLKVPYLGLGCVTLSYIVTNKTKAKIQLASGGGCAISLKVATTEDLEKKYKKL